MPTLLIILSLIFAAPAMAAQRVAERYHCTAFNPFTGYATITYSDQGHGNARMEYAFTEHEIHGGRMTYNTETFTSFPRAIFKVEIADKPISVYMDLHRPLVDSCENKLAGTEKEDILVGVTYVPMYGALGANSLLTPYAATGNPFMPVPIGYVMTSTVYCRVVFKAED